MTDITRIETTHPPLVLAELLHVPPGFGLQRPR